MKPEATRLNTALAVALAVFGIGLETHEALATLGGWSLTALSFASLVRSKELVDTLRRWWLVAAFLGWSLLMPLVTAHPPTGSGLARAADVLFLPFAAIAAQRLTERAWRGVAIAVGSIVLLACFVAALQYVGWWPAPEFFARYSWLQLPTDRVYEPVAGTTDRFMAGGLLFHRLKFANVTACLVVLAASQAFRRRAGWPFLAVVTSVGFLSVALFPQARAATVALALGLVVVALSAIERRGAAMVIGAVIIGGAALVVFAVPSWRERFTSGFEASASTDRVFLRDAGLAALGSSPLTGIGLGRFKPKEWLSKDAPEGLHAHQGKSHNQFLTVASEAGVPAALLLLALLGWLAAVAFRALPEGAGALGMVVLFAALSVLHDPLFHAESSMALFGSLGVALGLSRRAAAC